MCVFIHTVPCDVCTLVETSGYTESVPCMMLGECCAKVCVCVSLDTVPCDVCTLVETSGYTESVPCMMLGECCAKVCVCVPRQSSV